ncbi:MAG TPA: tRNA-uridine aminocarboxypropyltransferase [Polyangiaceae bacterium]
MSAIPRAVCSRCRRPASVCYCPHLTRVDTATRVVILQHPRERDVAIGTAHMASLCLANAELHVGVDWGGSPALARTFADPARPPVLLYPGDGATDVTSQPPAGPVTLVVVDGTWSQARKVVRTNPVLAALPRYAFTPVTPSDYRIRKEPSEECVSTIEALVHVLGVLERDPDRLLALLAPFRAMVDTQLACERRFRGAGIRHAATRRARPARRHLPRLLHAREKDILCVSGEANAWPHGSTERDGARGEELVHWTAFRPHTGERFDVVASPRGAIAPRTPVHVALSHDAIAAGCSGDDLRDRWRAFVRDTDVVCSWGTFAAALFERQGGLLPRSRLDLRVVVHAWAKRRVGAIDDALPALGLAEASPLAAGRAGRRLGQLVELARFLGREAEREDVLCGRSA